jgi:hypothetical protein
MASNKKIVLSDRAKQLFDAYVVTRDLKEAAKKVGMKYNAAQMMYNRKGFQEKLSKHNEVVKDKVFYDENQIIRRLWQEATDKVDNTGSMRINALKLLGEHIGMWRDKSGNKELLMKLNVVNYNNYNTEKPVKAEIIDQKLKEEIPEGIEVQSYLEGPEQ